MIIDCIADLHGFYPKLEGGDLLIIAGDLTAHNTEREYDEFCNLTQRLSYKKIVVIAGNHDTLLQYPDHTGHTRWEPWSSYLCDSGTEFEGLKIWGSPWTSYFDGMNPNCMAFTMNYGCDTDEWLSEKWALIPDDIDILITHAPPYGILDEIDVVTKWGTKQFCVGSKSLLKRVFEIRPKIHIFGHIHEGFGQYDHVPGKGSSEDIGLTPIKFINCSHVNELYEPVNKPIRIIL